MFNYKKLIKDNQEDFKNPEQLEDFLDAYMQEGQEVSEHEDNIIEYADGLVPIYYHDIMEEWRNNGECHGEAKEQGLTEGADGDVYKIMQMDLFCMYDQELRADYQILQDLIDDEPEPDDEDPEPEVKE